MLWLLVLLVVIGLVGMLTTPAWRDPTLASMRGLLLDSALFIQTEVECWVSVDGWEVGTLQPGELRRVLVGAGLHHVQATAVEGGEEWQTKVSAPADGLVLVEVGLQTLKGSRDRPDSRSSLSFNSGTRLVTVEIPPGLTLEETAGHLAKKGPWGRTELKEAFSDPGLIRDLDPQAGSLEGYLLPGKHQFPAQSSAGAVAAQLAEAFRARWVILGATADAESASDSIHDIVTLASLVERAVADARPRHREVASVYWNRLSQNMPLGSDAALKYGLMLAGGWNSGLLERHHLNYDSPYNTYRNSGLPPGPICSPGEASLVAAMQPARSNWLYFVASGTGDLRFAATIEEHRQNVQAFLRATRETREAKP